jgi:glycosyltransferase involved in cell wall biosynthesis
MKLMFEKGVPFYIEYQLTLFIRLLFRKTDLLFSNDLDTLLPNYIVSKIRTKPLIYDSHEYFTGVPELQETPTKRKLWKALERFILPKLRTMFTVNNSIAKLYHDEFGVDVKVMRNLPLKRKAVQSKTRKELNIPEDKSIIILQGAGINIHRGAEEAVQAMQYVNNTILLIVGDGDAIPVLKKMANDLHLEEKVYFIPRLPFEELVQYTMLADLGLTLDKDTNINYRYSLPNKLFDYIHAGLPVLASSLVEVKNIVETYQVGECIDSHDPKLIADKINAMLGNKEKLAIYKANTTKAAEELCWEKEKEVLLRMLNS